MQVTTIGLDIAKNVLWPASPGRCWPRAAPIACLRLRQRRKESGDGRMRLRLASVRSRTAGVMTALMRNGRDRRLGEPVMGHAILERVLLFGTRSADYTRASGHNGCIATEVTLQAKTEAEYMAAPERFADGQIPLAPRAPSIHDPSETLAANFAVMHNRRRPRMSNKNLATTLTGVVCFFDLGGFACGGAWQD